MSADVPPTTEEIKGLFVDSYMPEHQERAARLFDTWLLGIEDAAFDQGYDDGYEQGVHE